MVRSQSPIHRDNNRILVFKSCRINSVVRNSLTRTGGKCEPATGNEVCQFVYVDVVVCPMDLCGAVATGKELAYVCRDRGYPGSCALKALPNG
jgi:hypothetical protein